MKDYHNFILQMHDLGLNPPFLGGMRIKKPFSLMNWESDLVVNRPLLKATHKIHLVLSKNFVFYRILKAILSKAYSNNIGLKRRLSYFLSINP